MRGDDRRRPPGKKVRSRVIQAERVVRYAVPLRSLKGMFTEWVEREEGRWGSGRGRQGAGVRCYPPLGLVGRMIDGLLRLKMIIVRS